MIHTHTHTHTYINTHLKQHLPQHPQHLRPTIKAALLFLFIGVVFLVSFCVCVVWHVEDVGGDALVQGEGFGGGDYAVSDLRVCMRVCVCVERRFGKEKVEREKKTKKTTYTHTNVLDTYL